MGAGLTIDISRAYGTGTTTYGYDNNGRLTIVDGPYSNDNITYQYDELDRVTALLPQTGQALSYVYDTLGRLKDIQAGTNTFTYTYVGASQLIQTLTDQTAAIPSINTLTSRTR